MTTAGSKLAGARTAVRKFQVANVHCSTCARTLEEALRGLPGVSRATADARSGAVWLWFDPEIASESDLFEALGNGGYRVSRTV